jgi:hypothetical protein
MSLPDNAGGGGTADSGDAAHQVGGGGSAYSGTGGQAHGGSVKNASGLVNLFSSEPHFLPFTDAQVHACA